MKKILIISIFPYIFYACTAIVARDKEDLHKIDNMEYMVADIDSDFTVYVATPARRAEGLTQKVEITATSKASLILILDTALFNSPLTFSFTHP